MKIKFRCIMCSIIVSVIATTSFAAEVNKTNNIIEVQADNAENEVETEKPQVNIENNNEKDTDLKEGNDTKQKVYMCKPFYLDHFGIIRKSLKTFGVNGEELATYIREGKNLEQVLELENIPINKFKKEVIKQYNIKVKEGVKEGSITKEQAKKLRQAINQTIKKWLD